MELIQLKTAWGGGIIDKDTFVWMEDMDEWAPIHMIYGMERAIATWEGIFVLGYFAYVACQILQLSFAGSNQWLRDALKKMVACNVQFDYKRLC